MGLLSFLISVLCCLIICSVLASTIGAKTNAAAAGFWRGLLLGPVGVVIALFLDNGPKCPHCRSTIDREATKCPICEESLGNAIDDMLNARSKAEFEELLEKRIPPLNCDDRTTGLLTGNATHQHRPADVQDRIRLTQSDKLDRLLRRILDKRE
jgi:hypothetical protein